jgi:hypothetical protein
MNEIALMEVIIVTLFGLSLFIRLWEHSMSVFLMLLTGTVCIFLYHICPRGAAIVFSIAATYVTLRGAMKPKGDRIWL